MEPTCPMPLPGSDTVLLAHGSGGRLMHQLLEKVFLPAFANAPLSARHDGALLDLPSSRLAFTTDSYVVRPLVFPGGDIGALAVNGTVNDLAMCGARPLYLSAGFVLEEGLPLTTLRQVVQSMKRAADAADVQLVTGDTKVVERGHGDGIYINTSGIGAIESAIPIGPASVQPGDVIVLSGDIGRHGMAIMTAREGLELESQIESDCAPLAGMVLDLLSNGIELHCLRDLTRGGLATAIVEIAEAASLQIEIDESAIPVTEGVQGACELLGFDPMHVACEGRFMALLPASQAEAALRLMHAHELGRDANRIGKVGSDRRGHALLKSRIGATRMLDMLSGEQLPRIC